MSETQTNQDGIGIDRREFLRLSSAVAAAAALASTGCGVPPESTVPFNDMPYEFVDGVGLARDYHTVLGGSLVRVRTREGRPILVAPHANDPSGRGLSLRHHAALMDVYDPDRARGPLSLRRSTGPTVNVSWNTISADTVARLKSAGDRAVLLTGPIDSPALQQAIAAIAARTGMRHVVWSPLDDEAASWAWTQAFGDARIGRPLLDRADLIVGLGAEFLDRSAEGLEARFAVRRVPARPDEPPEQSKMSRFVQLEGRLTLTGANADRRIRVRDSRLATAAIAIAHELIVIRHLGPLAGDKSVAEALAPFSIDAMAGKAGVEARVLREVANELAGSTGRAIVVAGGSASTSAAGPAVELAAIMLNVTVGAFEAGLFPDVAGASAGGVAPLAALTAEMAAGRIDTLIVAGANPVYDAPASLQVSAALAKVPFFLSLNDRVDETTKLADYIGPTSHPFECWSDATLPGDLFAIQQPVVQTLYKTVGLLDLLVDWAAALGDPAALAAVTAATTRVTPPVGTAQRPPSPSPAFHYVHAAWAVRMALDPVGPQFGTAWTNALQTGSWQGKPQAAAPRRFLSAAAASLVTVSQTNAVADGFELQLYPHLAHHDGRAGNNGWLHELPDPITRITWGGALSMAPRRFDEMKLTNGDLVEVDAGHAKIVVPVYRHAGMHQDQVALPLGLGRTDCGPIGAGAGHNAFPIRRLADDRVIASGLPVTIRRVEGREELAIGQGSNVIDRARRPLVPITALSAYRRDAAAGTAQIEGGKSIWPGHEYPGPRWGMAIDLSKCNGCGKCVIGCQAENNIPIVGRQGMLEGRPMSWMRIDRYYDAPARDGGWDDTVWGGPLEVTEEPRTLFEPMLCQHCENAPCETVCPFAATMHSADGLNEQVYNRCVGTRYCANNCPFKVRRFNFWELSQKQESAFFRWLMPRIARNAELNTREPMQMKNNPEVTVRSRGVMEKCSFCIQRIRAATAEATRNGRPKGHLPEGTVVPACMEACPTGAITFGDVNAPNSRVAALKAEPRAMRLLDVLGVKPAIAYLTKVWNDEV